MNIKTNSPISRDAVVKILSAGGVETKVEPNTVIVLDGTSEGDLRVMLQEGLDKSKSFSFEDDYVLVNGNSVWSYKMIVDEMKGLHNAPRLSGYAYKFFTLNFGEAANGWITNKPGGKEIRALIDQGAPEWMLDVHRIIDKIQSTDAQLKNVPVT